MFMVHSVLWKYRYNLRRDIHEIYAIEWSSVFLFVRFFAEIQVLVGLIQFEWRFMESEQRNHIEKKKFVVEINHAIDRCCMAICEEDTNETKTKNNKNA